MNIYEYLINPMGRGSSVLMLTETRRSLDAQYTALMSKMQVKWYKYNDKFFIAHVKVPSKSIDNFYYDVLIEFDIESLPEGATTLNNAKCRVFSNCPSFTYTYVNIFSKSGDLIEWTRSKYDSKVFSHEPNQRNPLHIRNFERSIYFASKYVLSNGRNYKSKIEYNIFKVPTYQNILNLVASAQDTELKYKERKAHDKKRDENVVKLDSKTKKKEIAHLSNKNASGKTKSVTKTAKTAKTKTTKKTSKSRRF